PISGSHQAQQPQRLHSKAEYMAAPERFAKRSDSFPLHRGHWCPCRDDGGGEIVRCLASTRKGDRAFNIDPPASSYAIMRRARPYRGENSGPGKDHEESLTPRPGIREQHRPEPVITASQQRGPLRSRPPLQKMPLKRLLSENTTVDPDTIKALTMAYDHLCVALHLVNRDDPLKETVAKKIIEYARQGERDAVALLSWC